ncbi:MAG: hypothetical protein ABIN79_00100 [Marmoricola sp.]
MATVDLGVLPGTEPDPLHEAQRDLDPVPRRVRLSLAELLLLARLCETRLPFPVEPGASSGLTERLGDTPDGRGRELMARELARVDDTGPGSPVDRLREQGLLHGDDPTTAQVEPEVVTALRLLGAPEQTVWIDLGRVHPFKVQLHAWHHARAEGLATLATLDALSFELTWVAPAGWRAELARAATVSLAEPATAQGFPDEVVIGHDLLVAGLEAVRAGRWEVLAELCRLECATMRVEGRPVDAAEAAILLQRLDSETVGRLRASVGLLLDAGGRRDSAELQAPPGRRGLVSWVLLADGWRALIPLTDSAEHLVVVRRVEPDDLGSAVADLFAELIA